MTLHSAVDAAEAAIAAARCPAVDRSVLEVIAMAVLARADNQLGTVQVVHREMWENEGYRDYHRQVMRRELHEAVTSQGYVPIALPSETVRYLKMAPPSFGAEVPESVDWDTAEISLEVAVRTPPVDRAEAVRRGLLTGGASAS